MASFTPGETSDECSGWARGAHRVRATGSAEDRERGPARHHHADLDLRLRESRGDRLVPRELAVRVREPERTAAGTTARPITGSGREEAGEPVLRLSSTLSRTSRTLVEHSKGEEARGRARWTSTSGRRTATGWRSRPRGTGRSSSPPSSGISGLVQALSHATGWKFSIFDFTGGRGGLRRDGRTAPNRRDKRQS